MKTLLVTVAFAIAVGACSSDSSNALVTGSAGTVPQGGPCKLSTDCEPSQGLTCAFPIVNDAGACSKSAASYCVAMAQCDYNLACPCGSTTFASVCATQTYSAVPINPDTSACTTASGGDSGTAPAGDGGGA
jgi:hypothetical protein